MQLKIEDNSGRVIKCIRGDETILNLLNVRQLARFLKINESTLNWRLKNGYSLFQAITEPVSK
ncbi:hypothetical protein CH54_506 [Yersinia rochesterensis]|uniref:Uncharacterized protein n=1 Tax=Yersinia rochesterensis TaxID=1604335 RepID=A0ABM5SPI3_9GAMM|nr:MULTISPECIES: hypothetical protein [Yersinia]AJI87337.1 hypothetical protein AW19_1156 [Yersinia frederiksenii Y225]CRY63677.1 Uncharacterised protein [Yersinia kristensenii]AIN17750.1 hypothetical protein DJ57_1357 [Yersinia rochesterensis]AJJ36393.1 hypothetical protein CH54_506 [Yersinia rochesterensis]AJJ65035.1 hypothetical protein AT01_1693 [Yersinia aldovae 670-83]